MTKYVPFKTTYERVNQIEKVAFWCSLIAAIFIFSNWLINLYNFSNIEYYNINFEIVKESLKVASYVFVTFFLLFELIGRILFSEAERIKREDLVDNSFGTKFSDEKSQNYYNNDKVEYGILKFALNTYESAFHTQQVLKGMLLKSSMKLLILSIPFIVSIYTNGSTSFIRLLFELSIPLAYFFKVIIQIIYFTRVRGINTRFKTELFSIKKEDSIQLTQGKLLNPIMDYYNTKAWANMNLDTKIFDKINEETSAKWENRKKSLGF
jgi:hypothetical protein